MLKRTEVVHRPWQVLSDQTQVRFPYERELSYFQIKFWLNNLIDIKRSYRESSAWFGLFKLRDGLTGISRENMSKSDLSSSMQQLFRMTVMHAFAHDNLDVIFDAERLQIYIEARRGVERFIRFEIELAERQLALTVTHQIEGITPAQIWLEKARDSDVVGMTIGKRNRSFRPRVAYLVAAARCWPDLLCFGPNVRSSMMVTPPPPETFRQFCGTVRYISQILGVKGDVEIERDTKLPPVKSLIPWTVPYGLPDELRSTGRRSAEETRLGKAGRRQPL